MSEAGGTARSRIYISARDKRVDRRLLQRIFKPYWWRKGNWRPWLLLGLIITSSGAASLSGGWISRFTASQTNALVAKQAGIFWWFTGGLLLATLGRQMSTLFQQFLEMIIRNDWRH